MAIRPEAGRQLGRYRILSRLGAGAMGEVYLAEDPQIGRRLALKTVRLEEGRPQEIEERKKRLLREARAAGKLLHPNVVTLFDAGEDGGTLYLAFEYVEGTDLDRRIAEGPPLTLAEALAVVRQTAEGLDYAHRQGVVHRDIKPSNVMLTADGRVKIADFGIAKVLDSTSDLTMSGSVVGSPHYLSPEQIRGEALDGRTDVFSLGVLLYEILCHRRPFDGDTLTTLVYQILNQEPTPVEVRRPELGPRLEQLVRRMLHKDREQRFATAAEVAAEVAACERELAPELLAASAVSEPPSDATIRLPEDASTAMRAATAATAATAAGATLASASPTAARAVPPPPPPPSPSSAAAYAPASPKGRLALVAAVAVVAAVVLLALGWSARRWVADPEPPAKTAAAAAPAPAGPGTVPGTVSGAVSGTVPDPPPAAATAAPERAAAEVEEETEPPADEPPFHAGERGENRLPASPERTAPPVVAATAPAAARPAPVVPDRTGPPVVEEPAATAPAPELEPPPDPRAMREELIARIPVAREMDTAMNLSFEIEPKKVAERLVVRLDRIVLGRAADWNASKRGGRAYLVPEPGLHILTFLLDGAEVYRMRIDAQPGRSGPTPIAVDLAQSGRGPRRRPR